jgi:hypothetical protein
MQSNRRIQSAQFSWQPAKGRVFATVPEDDQVRSTGSAIVIADTAKGFEQQAVTFFGGELTHNAKDEGERRNVQTDARDGGVMAFRGEGRQDRIADDDRGGQVFPEPGQSFSLVR